PARRVGLVETTKASSPGAAGLRVALAARRLLGDAHRGLGRRLLEVLGLGRELHGDRVLALAVGQLLELDVLVLALLDRDGLLDRELALLDGHGDLAGAVGLHADHGALLEAQVGLVDLDLRGGLGDLDLAGSLAGLPDAVASVGRGDGVGASLGLAERNRGRAVLERDRLRGLAKLDGDLAGGPAAPGGALDGRLTGLAVGHTLGRDRGLGCDRALVAGCRRGRSGHERRHGERECCRSSYESLTHEWFP